MAMFYTSTAGNDAWDGTSPTFVSGLIGPKPTIAAGAALMTEDAGDTLFIKGGTYTEYLDDPFPGGTSFTVNPTTIRNAIGETVIIKGPNNQGRVINFSGSSTHFIIMEGLTIDGFGSDIPLSRGECIKIHVGASDIRVQNCTITNGASVGVLINNTAHRNEFLNNIFFHNGFDPQVIAYHLYIQGNDNIIDGNNFNEAASYGIQLFNNTIGGDCNDNILRNNLIRNSGMLEVGVNNRGAGIIVGSGLRNKVFNNVIWDGFVTSGLRVFAPETELDNNTIYNNVGDAIEFVFGGHVGSSVRNNAMWNNDNDAIVVHTPSGTPTGTVSNNVTTDPKFVSVVPGSENFHLTSASVDHRDAGVTLVGVTTDIEGNLRGEPPDVGAYEFVVGGGDVPVNNIAGGPYSLTKNDPATLLTGISIVDPNDPDIVNRCELSIDTGGILTISLAGGATLGYALLDSFTRNNESPLSNGTWDSPVVIGEQGAALVLQAAVKLGGSFAGSHWSSAFPADQEVFMKVTDIDTAASGQSVVVYLRLIDAGTTNRDGYFVQFFNDNKIQVFKITDNVSAQLGANIVADTVDGNIVGARVEGTTLTVFKDVGAGLVSMGTRDASDFNAPGKIAFTLSDTNHIIDDFGGGALSGQNKLQLHLEGTLTEINAALATLKYTPTTDFVGAVSLTMISRTPTFFDTSIMNISVMNETPSSIPRVAIYRGRRR